jgi:glucose-6-phosphate isomerase
MLQRINPTTTQAWFVLKKHHEEEMSRKHMRDLFAADPKRFENYSIATDQILFDYSKNIITEKTMQLLFLQLIPIIR